MRSFRRAFLLAAGLAGCGWTAAAAEPEWSALGPDSRLLAPRLLAVSPSSPQVVYAGTDSGGVQVSRDGGRSWQPASWGLTDGRVQALAVDSKRPQVAYLSTVGGGTFKTADFGRSWERLPTALDGALALLVDPRDPSRLYAGLENELQVSADGGATWTSAAGLALPSGEPYFVTTLAASADGRLLYLGTAGAEPGVYVSRNRGLTWQRRGDVSLRQLVVDPRSPDQLYGSDGRHFLRSRNGGVVWEGRNLGGPAAGSFFLAPGLGNPAPLYGLRSDAAVLASTDGGARWRLLGRLPGTAAEAGPLAAVGPRELLSAGSRTGLLRSGDGGVHWVPSQQGLVNSLVFSLTFGPRSALFAGTLDGLYARGAGGAWRRAIAGLTVFDVAAAPGSPDRLYAAGVESVAGVAPVWRSTDGGGSWQPGAAGLAGYQGKDLAVDPQLPDVAYLAAELVRGGGDRLFKSTDGGASWTPLPFPGLAAEGALREIEVTRPEPSAVYVSAGGNGLWRSRDGGASWQRVLAAPAGAAYDFALSPLDAETLYVLEEGQEGRLRLYESRDGGTTWQEEPVSSLPRMSLRLLLDPREPETLYAAGSRGLFRRRGPGDWEELSAGLYNPLILSLALDPQEPGRLVVGTAGAGAFAGREP